VRHRYRELSARLKNRFFEIKTSGHIFVYLHLFADSIAVTVTAELIKGRLQNRHEPEWASSEKKIFRLMRGRKIDSGEMLACSNHWMSWIRRNGGSNKSMKTKERAAGIGIRQQAEINIMKLIESNAVDTDPRH